jgi:hypothetical protein
MKSALIIQVGDQFAKSIPKTIDGEAFLISNKWPLTNQPTEFAQFSDNADTYQALGRLIDVLGAENPGKPVKICRMTVQNPILGA